MTKKYDRCQDDGHDNNLYFCTLTLMEDNGYVFNGKYYDINMLNVNLISVFRISMSDVFMEIVIMQKP